MVDETDIFALDFGYSAPEDEVSEYAHLYTTSLLQDKKMFSEPSLETLNFRGHTVSIVKDVVGMCGSQVPESVILAVSVLAFGSVCISSNIVVQNH